MVRASAAARKPCLRHLSRVQHNTIQSQRFGQIEFKRCFDAYGYVSNVICDGSSAMINDGGVSVKGGHHVSKCVMCYDGH